MTEAARGIFGVFAFMLLAWLLGRDRRAVNWRFVLAGLGLQLGLALLLLKVPGVSDALFAVNRLVGVLEEVTAKSAGFMFGYLSGGKPPFEVVDQSANFIVAFRVLPLVLVVSALSSVLFYLGALPWIIRQFARLLRRIEALTGALAWEALRRSQSRLDEISDLIKTTDDKIIPALEDKFSRLANLEKELSRLRLELFKYDANALIDRAEAFGNTKIICQKYHDLGMDMLRQIADMFKSRLSSYAFCLAAVCGSRAWLLAGLSDDIAAKGLDAAKIIKEVALLVDGSGGGRQALAQAGGSNPQQLDKALEKFREIIRSYLVNV